MKHDGIIKARLPQIDKERLEKVLSENGITLSEFLRWAVFGLLNNSKKEIILNSIKGGKK